MRNALLAFVSLLGAATIGIHSVQAQQLSPDDIARRTIERRAVEAVNWGMPAVNYDLMLQEMLGKTGDQVVYWSRPLDWHNQTLTPNPDAIYFMAFFNTKDGPIVVEVPPADDDGSLNANIVDLWQMPLEDAGPLGGDKGKGGKFLILPPGYSAKRPAGYIALRPETFGTYALLRSNLKSHGAAASLSRSPTASGSRSIRSRRPPTRRRPFHRRGRHRVRLHHPLRRDLLRIARPHRADRAMAAARPRDDRPAEVARHRKGQAVLSRREDQGSA